MRRGRTAVIVTCLAGIGLSGLVAVPVEADITTISAGPLRTAWDPSEPGLAPQDVASTGFGQLFDVHLPDGGQIYGQPIVADGRVIVATEENDVYALDAVTGDVEWTVDQDSPDALGRPWPAATLSCPDLRPDVGVTATPVVDPATDTLYLTSKTYGSDPEQAQWWMHALSLEDGSERWKTPIGGTPDNDPSSPFNATTANGRAGLLLLDGVVYAAFAGHCDRPPTRGYVVGVNATTGTQTALWTTAPDDPVNGESGIWMSGSGLMSDGPGRIFVATGNGDAPPVGPAQAGARAFGDSVVRLDVQPDGSLAPADYFAPSNARALSITDADFGSGGPVGLPDELGTASHPHLLVVAGKDGRVFLLDRDGLGGRGDANDVQTALESYGPYRGEWSHPAAWAGSGGWVYTTEVDGPLRAFRHGVDAAGEPALVLAGRSADPFSYTSGSPVVTSDGTTDSSALVWVVVSGNGATGAGAVLRAYDAVPDQDGILRIRWSGPIGTASKFSVPATDGDRVYLGTRTGDVLAFGRTSPPALTSDPYDAGTVDIGATADGAVSFTAAADTTVNSITTTGPFTATAPSLPLHIAADGTSDVPIRFAPTQAGRQVGTLTLETDHGTVVTDLRGVGRDADGLSTLPGQMSFDATPKDTTATNAVLLLNARATAVVVTGVTLPGAPFTVPDAPAVGTVVAAGQSVAVHVGYTPTDTAAAMATLTIHTSDGAVPIPLSGAGGLLAGKLVVHAHWLHAGPTPVGAATQLSFEVSNDGLGPVTIDKAKPPAGDFSDASPIVEGSRIAAGHSIVQTVTFRPSAPGRQTNTYELTGNDGTHRIVHLTGTGTGTLPGFGSRLWSVGGTATVTHGQADLTPLAPRQAGSVIFRRMIPAAGLRAHFTVRLGGGSGGAGMSFVLLDPTVDLPAVGRPGDQVGFGRLAGYAVVLDTERSPGQGSSNFLALASSTAGGKRVDLDSVTLPRSLRSGTHAVAVHVGHGRIQIYVDRLLELDVTIHLADSVVVGFTAATGSRDDRHRVISQRIGTG